MLNLDNATGWKRLWLVFVGLYFVATSAIFVSTYLSDAQEIDNARTKGAIELWIAFKLPPDSPHVSADQLRYSTFEGFTNDEVIAWIKSAAKDQVNFERVERLYERKMTDLSRERVWFTVFVAVSTLVLYLFGLVVAWVVRGFRKGN